ncbi:MAG: hypothetical protein HUJ98_14770 [Bacteroidaceae bacterium]|nr:hypothetical protein [Bacteroidaceae bacterium]MCF0187738.1 hypothetical protein [Bacteroidaceae bacterium]
MNKLLSFCIMLTVFLPISAQDAKHILEKAEQHFLQYTGIEASFSVRNVNEGFTQYGKIALQGKRFKLQTEGMTTWFDGKTQWTYIQSNDEVNVSEPDDSELESINPYAFLSLYKNGYSLKMGKSDHAAGRPAYEVHLLAEKKSQTIWQMVLMLDRQTYQPIQIKIRQRFDKWLIFNITSFTEKHWDDDHFTFQKSEAPNAEIIDLR